MRVCVCVCPQTRFNMEAHLISPELAQHGIQHMETIVCLHELLPELTNHANMTRCYCLTAHKQLEMNVFLLPQ